ncbi:MAG: hypothetical protein AAB368_13980 [bacterium]
MRALLMRLVLAQRVTQEGTLLASAARTATTYSAVQTNYGARGAFFWFTVTAFGTGTLSFKLALNDPVSGQLEWVLSPTAVSATGYKIYLVGPFVNSLGNITSAANGQLPRLWKIGVVHTDASSHTYSVGYQTIV